MKMVEAVAGNDDRYDTTYKKLVECVLLLPTVIIYIANNRI